jgi:hypothetical protein
MGGGLKPVPFPPAEVTFSCGHPRKQGFVRPQGDYALYVRMIPGKGSPKSQFRFPPAEVTFLFAGILESKVSYARKGIMLYTFA